MKRILAILIAAICLLSGTVGLSTTLEAQINWNRALKAVSSTAKAVTLSDKEVEAYVHQYIMHEDSVNKVEPETSAYTKRLRRLTSGLTEVEGIPLNFKVYNTKDVNAFACADGSVRVYTGLMDIMDDDELLGVIGHEMGHVALHHSRNAFKSALLRSALRDGIASTGAKAAVLTDSQLSQVGEALANANYSKKQENQADDYGYEFLKKNGKNPSAMVKSFNKLKELSGNSQNRLNAVNQLFSSHPDINNRIKRMEKKCTKDGISVK